MELALCGCVALCLWVIGAPAAQATRAPIHLTAVVYDVHDKNGVVSSREKVYENGKRVGGDFTTCKPHGRKVHCEGEYTLSGDHLKFAGVISATAHTNTLQITGGTGSYRGERGQVRTEYSAAETRAKETITFSS